MHTIEFIDTEGKRRFLRTEEANSNMSETYWKFFVKEKYNTGMTGKNKIKGVKKVLRITEEKK